MERVRTDGIRVATRITGCVIVALAGLAMTACGPTIVSITAVFLDGGRPVALFHPCRGSFVDSVTISERERDEPGSTASRFWHGVDVTRDQSGARPTQVRLLELPAGWVQVTRPEALITSFVDGRSYWVVARFEPNDKNAENDVGVEFTPLDLRGLGEGQVWARPDQFKDEQAMSLEEFRDSAADSC